MIMVFMSKISMQELPYGLLILHYKSHVVYYSYANNAVLIVSALLWIRSSQTSNAGAMLDSWLKEVNYHNLTSGICHIPTDTDERYSVYTLSGVRLLSDVRSTAGLSTGIYIINGKKTIISK